MQAKQYLKAQQTATKLYKVDDQGGKFIIWAAATMLIQAERKDSSAGVMTLPLAEKMTVKILAVDVYRQLGSFARGLTIFGQLDVKQIQVRCKPYLT
eukprot:g15507.t1